MRRGRRKRCAIIGAVGVAAALLVPLGGPQAQTSGPAIGPPAIPEPSEVTVSTRRVERGEMAISDPVEVTVGPLRSNPYLEPIPEPNREIVGADRTLTEPPAAPDVLPIDLATERRSPPAPPEIRDPDSATVVGDREDADLLALDDPLEMGFSAARVALPIDDAVAAIAACDFATIREQLRYLLTVSDQIDGEGRSVVAELSRLNRANTAFETARVRYDEGRFDDARDLLLLAGTTQCEEREEAIEDGLAKIERIKSAVAKIDHAIAVCNIPAMSSLQAQLAGQTHRTLIERKAKLDAISAPAANALAASERADEALSAGRIADTSNALQDAARELAAMPDTESCSILNDRVIAQQQELSRIQTLVDTADAAVAACDIGRMTKLSRTLAGERNPILVDKKTELDAVGTPASAAQNFLGGGTIMLAQGRLDDADAMLGDASAQLNQIDDPALCEPLRQDTTAAQAELDRVRGLLGEIDDVAMACTPGDIAGLRDRLNGESHVLLAQGRELLEKLSGPSEQASGALARAATLFTEGSLEEASRQLEQAREALSPIGDISQCDPLVEQIDEQRAAIDDVESAISMADGALATCDAGPMMAVADRLESADHRLLVERRENLIETSAPVAQARALYEEAQPHYDEGRLDEARQALNQASGLIESVATCGNLGEEIQRGLDKVERMQSTLAKIDGAVAACNIPAITAMSRQLDGQTHALLSARREQILAVNGPAADAERMRRRAAERFDAGDLDGATAAYNNALASLARIDSNVCDPMSAEIEARVDEISEIATLVASADDAIAACEIADMRTMRGRLDGRDYRLLSERRTRLDDIVGPLAGAIADREAAEPLFQDGELDAAEQRLETANRKLSQIDGGLCAPEREAVADILAKIDAVRTLIADTDSAMAACDGDRLEVLAPQLEAAEHRLLRSKNAELADYFTPISAARNLGELAQRLYFEGNLNGAETRLKEAREELDQRSGCREMIMQVESRLDRIDQMRTTLSHVDAAINACRIPAMASMSEQLAGQGHLLLAEKKRALDDIYEPVAAAAQLRIDAVPLYENGQLVAAETRLEDALARLDSVDSSLCLPLRRDIAGLASEVDRVRSTLVLVDNAIQSCNYADIDLLLANLASATHTSLVRARAELKSGRLRCGPSDDEKYEQALQTCARKHPNSVVDEFDPVTGQYNCVCPADFVWDATNAACRSGTDVQAAANAICEGGYPNSEAVNLQSPTEFECNCREGFVWNVDETACVSAEDVVAEANEFCAREGGYPVEIEGAGRYTCCSTGTVWDKSQRECVPESSAGTPRVSDPECRWIRDLSGTVPTGYTCTCSPENLCGPNPGGGIDSTTSEPAAVPETASEAASPDDAEEGVLDKVKDFFGKIF